MADDADPPRRFYQLKPKDFAAVNTLPAGAAPVAPTQPDPGVVAASSPDEKIDVHEIFRRASQGGAAPSAQPVAPVINDVQALLRDNHARENTAGLNDVAPRPRRPSRRRRDFKLALIIGYLVLGSVLVRVPKMIPLVLLLFTAVLVWVMWFVMDDY